MRQTGVLDVGCHSALLSVARRAPGTEMEEIYRRKVRLRLHEALDRHGRLAESGVESVRRAVAGGVPVRGGEVFAFATSVIRDAPNRDEVIARVKHATDTRLRFLSGTEEARLAYVAARRWSGRPDRELLVLDIGGGTLEVASGTGEQPSVVRSLPLGARRVTCDHLPGGTAPDRRRLDEIRDLLRHTLSRAALPTATPGARAVACSRTFIQLARLTAHLGDPPGDGRRLTLTRLRAAVPLLAAMKPPRRAHLPGISRHRAEQSLAGALIAQALMEACGTSHVEISPWSTREGLLLERLDTPATGCPG